MRFADEYGFYELNPFPGSNQIVVSNHAFIYPKYRNCPEKYGQLQHRQRLLKAKELGYDMIICTVRLDNEIEKHILRKFGWGFLECFSSVETEHSVELWARHLKNL